LAKIDLKKHGMSLSPEKERKGSVMISTTTGSWKLQLWKASSKRVKETAATHKTQIKEKALEASTQSVQTMTETYQGIPEQFPDGLTSLENVST
jgi:hypothetical protein